MIPRSDHYLFASQTRRGGGLPSGFIAARARGRRWRTAYSPCLLRAGSPSTSSASARARATPSSPLLLPACEHLRIHGRPPPVVLCSGRPLASRRPCLLAFPSSSAPAAPWLTDAGASLPWPPLPPHVARQPPPLLHLAARQKPSPPHTPWRASSILPREPRRPPAHDRMGSMDKRKAFFSVNKGSRVEYK